MSKKRVYAKVDSAVCEKIDRMVSDGHFKSRSDAVNKTIVDYAYRKPALLNMPSRVSGCTKRIDSSVDIDALIAVEQKYITKDLPNRSRVIARLLDDRFCRDHNIAEEKATQTVSVSDQPRSSWFARILNRVMPKKSH